MNVKDALIIGFKTKGLRFYGRSSRAEFWYFYISTCIFIALSWKLNIIPVVGGLLQAIAVLAIVACQITATIRRFHDLNMDGRFVLFPYLMGIVYAAGVGPLRATQPQYADLILNTLTTLAGLSYASILIMCAMRGTVGKNKYGTDPLDKSTPPQDFINPDHMKAPDLMGDPWKRFKDKVDQEKARKAAGQKDPGFIAVPTPGSDKKAETGSRDDNQNSSGKDQNK